MISLSLLAALLAAAPVPSAFGGTWLPEHGQGRLKLTHADARGFHFWGEGYAGVNLGRIDGHASYTSTGAVSDAVDDGGVAQARGCKVTFTWKKGERLAVTTNPPCGALFGAGASIDGTYVRSDRVPSPASFNCKAASTPVEREICTSPTLARADKLLAAEYRKLLGQPGVQREALQSEQRAWLARRNASCGGGSPRCLARSYRLRLRALERRRSGAKEGWQIASFQKARAELWSVPTLQLYLLEQLGPSRMKGVEWYRKNLSFPDGTQVVGDAVTAGGFVRGAACDELASLTFTRDEQVWYVDGGKQRIYAPRSASRARMPEAVKQFIAQHATDCDGKPIHYRWVPTFG